MYYRIQIFCFLIIAKLLFNLIKKEQLFLQTLSYQELFNYIKKAITSAPILATLNYQGRIIFLGINASSTRASAVIKQIRKDRLYYLVRFNSILQLVNKRKQHLTKLEYRALLQALKKFRYQLYSIHFTIETNILILITQLNRSLLEHPSVLID